MPETFRSGAAGAAAGFPARLRMPRRFFVYAVGPGEFRVQSAAQNVSIGVLRHPDAFASLAEGAAEGFDTAALLAGLPDGERREMEQVLRLLLDRGMLVDDALPAPEGAAGAARYGPQRLFFSHFDAAPAGAPSDGQTEEDGRDAQRRLCASSVTVLGLGQAGSAVARALALAGVGRLTLADASPVREEDVWGGAFYAAADVGRPRAEALSEQLGRLNEHVRAEPAAWSPDAAAEAVRPLVEGASLAVLCPDDFHPAAYGAVNEACLAAGTPWINRRALGFEVSVGPLVVPGESPCYRCFDLRLLGNLIDAGERQKLHAHLDREALHTGWLPVAHGVELLVSECLKRLSGFRSPATIGHAVFLSPAGGDVRRRPLLRIPRCPACGRGARHERPSIDPWAHA
jgi:bacteriocin biosynthesis cyclodehydratase domain-containing protein